jgi:carboxyl-terminal processing protease
MFAAAVAVLLAGIWLGGHPGSLPPLLRSSVFERGRKEPVTEQALNLLSSRFFRPVDRAKLVDLGLAKMVQSLDDPYSRYVDPSTHQAPEGEDEVQTVGIGIGITADPKGLRVLDVLENSPAAGAGLTRDDLIVKVGSTSLAGRDEAFGADLIRGPAGTPVTLTFLRDGTEHEVRLTRAKTERPIVSEQMLSHDGVRIGYLRLTEFSEGSGEELRAAAQTVLHEHARALILDLRQNGGGLIREAITVASIFIEHGTIMSAVERGQGRRVYDAHGDAIAPRLPLVVLVDHRTASSAEIVTAALQDHGRAKVVGTRTHGKGVFQLTLPLSNGGALDISIGEFFTPDGRNLGDGGGDAAGIAPNISAADTSDSGADEALAVAERTVAEAVRTPATGG